jgi:hypothetical protein
MRKETTMTAVALSRGALVILVALASATTGCDLGGTRGEGAITTEARQVGSFAAIESGAGIGVAVQVGPAPSLEVHAQANLLPIIVSEVQNGTLRLHSDHGYTTTEKVEVVITTPSLTRIVLSGGSQGQIQGLTSDDLDVELTGGSRLSATGEAADVILDMSGGSTATLEGLSTKTIRLDLSGGCTTTVRASDRVSGSATGGSRITVLGDAELMVDSSGDSRVGRG